MSKAYSIHYDGFTIDKNLAYLIQQITGDSTRDILAYFYGLGAFTAEEAIAASKAYKIDKKVVLMYRGTNIPYKLEVSSQYGWQKANKVHITMTVRFPQENDYFDCTTLLDEITEVGLGLVSDESDPLPKFERPTFKTPIFLRDLRREYERKFGEK